MWYSLSHHLHIILCSLHPYTIVFASLFIVEPRLPFFEDNPWVPDSIQLHFHSITSEWHSVPFIIVCVSVCVVLNYSHLHANVPLFLRSCFKIFMIPISFHYVISCPSLQGKSFEGFLLSSCSHFYSPPPRVCACMCILSLFFSLSISILSPSLPLHPLLPQPAMRRIRQKMSIFFYPSWLYYFNTEFLSKWDHN